MPSPTRTKSTEVRNFKYRDLVLHSFYTVKRLKDYDDPLVLGLVSVSGAFQRAGIAVTGTLSDGTSQDVSSAASLQSSDAAVVSLSGTVAVGGFL